MTRFLAALFLLATVSVQAVETNTTGQAYRLASQGDKLTDQQVADLEKSLADAPDNMDGRTKLLGYYFRRQFFDEAIQKKYTANILWIIANHPESDIAGSPFIQIHSLLAEDGYDQARQSWTIQVAKAKNNPAVLANAASFLLVRDKDLAEKYLKQLEEQEPANPQWPERLAFLYRLEAQSARSMEAFRAQMKGQGNESKKSARDDSAQALAKMETVFQLTGPGTNQTQRFLEAAQDAYGAGDLVKARSYTEEYLAKTPVENPINMAMVHTLLGEVDLQEDKVESAKSHLLAVGKIESWPQVPLELAKGLLAKGEKDAVIAYLELCKTSWKGRRLESLERWIKELRDQGTTEFREQGLTPAQAQASLKSMMTPEQFAAFTNRIAMAVHNPHFFRPDQMVTTSPKWGIGVSGEGLLKWLDGLWINQKMDNLQAQVTSGGESLTSLLTAVVYTSFIQDNQRGRGIYLQKAETIARQHGVKSMADFKTALLAAEQKLPQQLTGEQRIQAVFKQYPNAFPLDNEIRKVGRELQAGVDEKLRAMSRWEYFECRGREVFYINQVELDGQIMKATAGISGVIDAPKRAAEEKNLAGAGITAYLIDPSYYVEKGRALLHPRPDVHGDGAAALEESESQFQKALANLDRQSRTIHFVVRADSAEIFKKAQSLAEAAGFTVSSESLADDEPILIGPEFDANGIVERP